MSFTYVAFFVKGFAYVKGFKGFYVQLNGQTIPSYAEEGPFQVLPLQGKFVWVLAMVQWLASLNGRSFSVK